jgi:hypothetical protein
MKDPISSNVEFNFLKNNLAITAFYFTSLKENDATTIVLSLNSGYKKGDSVSIEFIGGNLESADGGLLEPFGPVKAYNWTSALIVNIPGKIEAEGFNDMFGIQTEPTNDTDGGLDITSINSGDWLEYLINVNEAKQYILSLRYSSLSGSGNVSLASNSRFLGTRSLSSTGSWDTWKTVTQAVGLNTGQQTLRLTASTGGFKLNWLSIDNTSTAVEENINFPQFTKLEQNYPNPFNPSTEIKYSLKDEGIVLLKIYNSLGQEVKTLINKFQSQGEYSVNFNAANLASGIYFYRLQAGSYNQVRKMLLSK